MSVFSSFLHHFHLFVLVSTLLQCYVITLLTISLRSTLLNHVDHVGENERPAYFWSPIRICDLSYSRLFFIVVAPV